MIPDGIQVNPVNGQLDSQVDVTVESYSGRLMNDPRELFCYTEDNTAEDSVTIWQEGKQEYISINEPLVYDVPAVGDTITITGSSNSREISIKGGGDDFTYEFYVNGEKVENWDGKTIPGDIGAKEEFTWEIRVTIPENRSDNPRSWNVYFTNNEEINTGYVIINQAAGVRTYGDLVIDSFTYSPNPVSAAGGTSVPTVTYHQYWGWNGTTDDGGVITSGASMTFSGTYIDSSSGNASIPSKGTTISNVTNATTSTVVVTSHGMSDTASCGIQQAKNIIVSGSFVDKGYYSYNIIPASGGDSPPKSGGTGKYDRIWTYSSGATMDDNGTSPTGYNKTVTSNGWSIASNLNGFTINTSNGTVSAPNRGTTIGNQWNSDTITQSETCTLTPISGYEYATTVSQTYELTAICSQEKNVPVSITSKVGYAFRPDPIGNSGGIATGNTGTYYYCNWTSGEQSYHHAQFDDPEGVTIHTTNRYTTIVSNAGATIDLTPNGKVTWAANNSGERSVTVRGTVNYKLTISSTYGGGTLTTSGYKDAVSTQSAGGMQRIEVVEEWSYRTTSISAAGGSSSFRDGGYCNVYLGTGEVIKCTTSGTYNGFTITFKRTASASMSTGFSFNSSSYVITASSRGTTLGAVRYCGTVSTTLTATVVTDASLGGETITDSDTYSDTNMVSQAMNTITALTTDFRFSYSKTVLSPSGETVARTLNDLGYNVTYSSGATSTERNTIANLSATNTESYSMTSSSGWSISTSTGSVTVTALPQGATSRTSGTISGTATYTVTDNVNNKTLSASKTYTYGTLTQTANAVTGMRLIITPGTNGTGWLTPTDDDGWDNVPASGGYIGVFGTIEYTYSDGSTKTEDAGWLYASDGLEASVSWATDHTYGGFKINSRNTTIGNAREGYMEWHYGGAVSNRVYFTQVGNYVESIDVTTTLTYPKDVPSSGGLVSPSRGTYYIFSFTSGSTSNSTPSGVSVSLDYSYSGRAANGFSAPNSVGQMTASDMGTSTGSSRNSGTVTQTATVTVTHNSTYSAGGTVRGSDTDTDYATQVANSVVKTECRNVTVSITANPTTISAGGGTSTLSYSGSYQTRTQYSSGEWSDWSTVNVTPTITGSATGFTRNGTTVTAADRGTTTGAARSVTYTATVNACNQTVTDTVTITQNANTMSYSDYRVKAYVKDGSILSQTITLTNTGNTHVYVDEFALGETPLQRYMYIEGNATYSSGSSGGWVKLSGGSYSNLNLSTTNSRIRISGGTSGTDALPYKFDWTGLTQTTIPTNVVTITFNLRYTGIPDQSITIYCYGVHATSAYDDSEVPATRTQFAIGARTNGTALRYTASSSILSPVSASYDDGVSAGIYTKLVTMSVNTTGSSRSVTVTSIPTIPGDYPILGNRGNGAIQHMMDITQARKEIYDIRVYTQPTSSSPRIVLRRANGTVVPPKSTLTVTMTYVWGSSIPRTTTGTWSTSSTTCTLNAPYISGSTTFNVVSCSISPTNDSTYFYAWNGNIT